MLLWVRGELQCSTVQTSASSLSLSKPATALGMVAEQMIQIRLSLSPYPAPVPAAAGSVFPELTVCGHLGATQGMAVTVKHCTPLSDCPSLLGLCPVCQSPADGFIVTFQAPSLPFGCHLKLHQVLDLLMVLSRQARATGICPEIFLS